MCPQAYQHIANILRNSLTASLSTNCHRDPHIYPTRSRRSTGLIKARTGSMIHQPTTTIPTPYSSLRDIQLAATESVMTVEVLKQWRIGLLQAKTTSAATRGALITIKAISLSFNPTKTISIRHYLRQSATRLHLGPRVMWARGKGSTRGTKSTCFQSFSHLHASTGFTHLNRTQ